MSEGVTAIHQGDAPDQPLGAPCFVRVTRADHRGFVEFEFSVGEAGPSLDMILPPAAFADYCTTHGARPRDRYTHDLLHAARAAARGPGSDGAGER